MPETQDSRELERYRPGGYGGMVPDEGGSWVRAEDVQDVLRRLEPHLVDRVLIARALALIERLR